MLTCGAKGANIRLACDRCSRQLREGEPLYLTDRQYLDLAKGEWHRESLCADCAGRRPCAR